ncbi:hypothetical protein [Sulfitobacter sp.]|uniref:hypothetical protein n=1 Tax=Sulfitobacter sp. TaxID=1903071 RepID=UPI003EF78F56
MSYFDDPALAVLREFTSTNSEALQNASLLLGGQPALRATIRILDDLRDAHALTRRMRADLQRLYELLSLTHVHDPDRPEAGYFAMIDPEWSAVEDICLLSDQLSDLLDAFDDQPVSRDTLSLVA